MMHKHKHTNKNKFQKRLLKLCVLQCYVLKLEKFDEFASDKTEKMPTLNCFQCEHCGQAVSFTRVDRLYLHFSG
jgi:hypothetical protein